VVGRATTVLLLGLAALVAAAGPGRADAVLERGRAVYRARCTVCHGADGAGDGEGAYLVSTPPRNFRRAQFRFVSTWDRVPTDDDLLWTVTHGLRGTQMPAFAALSDADRRAVVAVVKSFAERPWTIGPSRPPDADGFPGSGVIVVPPEPPDARTNRARAAMLFADACAPCHGPAGRGDGRDDLVDADGRPIRARDFTLGVFKGDPSPAALYRRIVGGIPGTPMPANPWAYGDDAWYLVHWVRSLGPPPPAP